MKILKNLLYVIIGLILLFLIMGMIKPTVEYGHEITVNKSVKEAWAVHQDESRLGEWLAGFKSIELLEGESGAVGSKYKVLVNPGEGQEDFEMTETITEMEAFKKVGMQFDSDMMIFDQTTTFGEKDGKTTIKTDSKVKGKGIMMRSMFAVMEMFGGSFQKQEELNVDALKKVIEENTTDYYPVVEEVIEEVIPESDEK